ncbi:hypothetical protein QAD02_011422 [Eretmocerus hayati]|uniref:Uncharacterized protein n=1 Tax=Eretmocerus hayati TaxID=131215 RepID=A0ACC2NWW5_9HYME|nr:hypothetical protein QAD02_011422 [Eretmocerus hayati]
MINPESSNYPLGPRSSSSPALEKKTYTEKRRFWEDIASSKRESFQRSESEISHASQLTYHDSDSEGLSDVRERSDGELEIPGVDMSECSVAEKAHYFEEQIQRESTAAKGVIKSQSSYESSKNTTRLSGISISSEDDKSFGIFEESRGPLEEKSKDEMKFKDEKKDEEKDVRDLKAVVQQESREKNEGKVSEVKVDSMKKDEENVKKKDISDSKDEPKSSEEEAQESNTLRSDSSDKKDTKVLDLRRSSKDEKSASSSKDVDKKSVSKKTAPKSDQKTSEPASKSKVESDLSSKEVTAKSDKKAQDSKSDLNKRPEKADMKTKAIVSKESDKESKLKATKMQENVSKQLKDNETRSSVPKDKTGAKSIPSRQKSKEEPLSKSPPKKDKSKEDALSKSPPKKEKSISDAPKIEKSKVAAPSASTQAKSDRSSIFGKSPPKKDPMQDRAKKPIPAKGERRGSQTAKALDEDIPTESKRTTPIQSEASITSALSSSVSSKPVPTEVSKSVAGTAPTETKQSKGFEVTPGHEEHLPEKPITVAGKGISDTLVGGVQSTQETSKLSERPGITSSLVEVSSSSTQEISVKAGTVPDKSGTVLTESIPETTTQHSKEDTVISGITTERNVASSTESEISTAQETTVRSIQSSDSSTVALDSSRSLAIKSEEQIDSENALDRLTDEKRTGFRSSSLSSRDHSQKESVAIVSKKKSDADDALFERTRGSHEGEAYQPEQKDFESSILIGSKPKDTVDVKSESIVSHSGKVTTMTEGSFSSDLTMIEGATSQGAPATMKSSVTGLRDLDRGETVVKMALPSTSERDEISHEVNSSTGICKDSETVPRESKSIAGSHAEDLFIEQTIDSHKLYDSSTGQRVTEEIKESVAITTEKKIDTDDAFPKSMTGSHGKEVPQSDQEDSEKLVVIGSKPRDSFEAHSEAIVSQVARVTTMTEDSLLSDSKMIEGVESLRYGAPETITSPVTRLADLERGEPVVKTESSGVSERDKSSNELYSSIGACKLPEVVSKESMFVVSSDIIGSLIEQTKEAHELSDSTTSKRVIEDIKELGVDRGVVDKPVSTISKDEISLDIRTKAAPSEKEKISTLIEKTDIPGPYPIPDMEKRSQQENSHKVEKESEQPIPDQSGMSSTGRDKKDILAPTVAKHEDISGSKSQTVISKIGEFDQESQEESVDQLQKLMSISPTELGAKEILEGTSGARVSEKTHGIDYETKARINVETKHLPTNVSGLMTIESTLDSIVSENVSLNKKAQDPCKGEEAPDTSHALSESRLGISESTERRISSQGKEEYHTDLISKPSEDPGSVQVPSTEQSMREDLRKHSSLQEDPSKILFSPELTRISAVRLSGVSLSSEDEKSLEDFEEIERIVEEKTRLEMELDMKLGKSTSAPTDRTGVASAQSNDNAQGVKSDSFGQTSKAAKSDKKKPDDLSQFEDRKTGPTSGLPVREKSRDDIPKSLIPRREKSKDEITLIKPKREKSHGEIPKSMIPKRERSKEELPMKSVATAEHDKGSSANARIEKSKGEMEVQSARPKKEKSQGEIPKSMIPKREKSKDEFSVRDPIVVEGMKGSPETVKKEGSEGEIPKSSIPRREKSKEEFSIESSLTKDSGVPLHGMSKREKSFGEIPKSMIPRREKSKDEFSIKSPPSREKSCDEIPKSMIPRREKSKDEFSIKSPPSRERSCDEIPKSMIPRREKSKDEFSIKSPPSRERSCDEIPKSMIPRREKSKDEFSIKSPPSRERSCDEIPKSMIPRREKSKDEFSIKSPPSRERSCDEIPKSMIPRREKSKDEFSIKSPPSRERSCDEIPKSMIPRREKSKDEFSIKSPPSRERSCDEIPKSMIPRRGKSKDEFSIKSPPSREKSRDEIPKSMIPRRERSKDEFSIKSPPMRERSMDDLHKSALPLKRNSKDEGSAQPSVTREGSMGEIPRSMIPRREKSKDQISLKSPPTRSKTSDEVPESMIPRTERSSDEFPVKSPPSREKSSDEIPRSMIPRRERSKDEISIKSARIGEKSIDSISSSIEFEEEKSRRLSSGETISQVESSVSLVREKSSGEIPKSMIPVRSNSKDEFSIKSSSLKDTSQESLILKREKSSSELPKSMIPRREKSKEEFSIGSTLKKRGSKDDTPSTPELQREKSKSEIRRASIPKKDKSGGESFEKIGLMRNKSRDEIVRKTSLRKEKSTDEITTKVASKKVETKSDQTSKVPQKKGDTQLESSPKADVKKDSVPIKSGVKTRDVKEIRTSTSKSTASTSKSLPKTEISKGDTSKISSEKRRGSKDEPSKPVVKYAGSSKDSDSRSSSTKSDSPSPRTSIKSSKKIEPMKKEIGSVAITKKSGQDDLKSRNNDNEVVSEPQTHGSTLTDDTMNALKFGETCALEKAVTVITDQVVESKIVSSIGTTSEKGESERLQEHSKREIADSPETSLVSNVSDISMMNEDPSLLDTSSQMKSTERDMTGSPCSMTERVESGDLDEKILQRQKISAANIKEALSSFDSTVSTSTTSAHIECIGEFSGARVLEVLEPDDGQSRQDSMDVPSIETDEIRVQLENHGTNEEQNFDRQGSHVFSSGTMRSDSVTFSGATTMDLSLSRDSSMRQNTDIHNLTKTKKAKDSFEIDSPPLISPKSKIRELEIKPVDWMIGDEKIEVSDTLEPSQAFDKELEEYQNSLVQQDIQRLEENDSSSTDFEIPRIEETRVASDESSTQASSKSKFTVMPVNEQDLEMDTDLVEKKLDISCQELIDTLQREYDAKTPTDDRLEEITARPSDLPTKNSDKDDVGLNRDEIFKITESNVSQEFESSKSTNIPLETKTAINVIERDQFTILDEFQKPHDSTTVTKDDDLLSLYEENSKTNQELKDVTITKVQSDSIVDTKVGESIISQIGSDKIPTESQSGTRVNQQSLAETKVKQSYDLENYQEPPEPSEMQLKLESDTQSSESRDDVQLLSYKPVDPEKARKDDIRSGIEPHRVHKAHRDNKFDVKSKGWEDQKRSAEKREKSHGSHSETSLFKTKRDDLQGVDMSSRYAITVLDQVVKKEIAEVKENLQAAKQDLIEELSENRENMIQIEDSPSEFQFKLQPESIPNELPFLYKAPSFEKVSDSENLSTSSSPIAKPRRHDELLQSLNENLSDSGLTDQQSIIEVTSNVTTHVEDDAAQRSGMKSEDVPLVTPKAASRSGSIETETIEKDDNFTLQPPQPAPRRRQKPNQGTSESEAEFSSSESNYQSCEYGSGSRPCSSDVEALLSGTQVSSSEYETAKVSFGRSSSKATSQDYLTAASTLSSKDSMKSFDHSISSGQMCSLDSASEISETLMASEAEIEQDAIDDNLECILDDDDAKTAKQSQGDAGAKTFGTDSESPPKMKRSSEMIFSEVITPEPGSEGKSTDVKSSSSTTLPGKQQSSSASDSSDFKTAESMSSDGAKTSVLGAIPKRMNESLEEKSHSSSEQIDSKAESYSFEPDSLETKYAPPGNLDDNFGETFTGSSGLTLQQQLSMTSSSMSGVSLETVIEKEHTDRHSPDSDSFELVDKPDLIDDFVVVEEVGKEAEEFDSEGKGIRISSIAYTSSKNFDRDVENLIVEKGGSAKTQSQTSKNAPVDLFEFDSEESPRQSSNEEQYSQSFSDEEQYAEGSKKWIEMQFQQNEARLYDMEYERGPLEDIKEEEVADFEAGSSRIGSMGSQKESIGSFGSIRGSFGSTPDNYDALTAKRYFKPTDHDNVSLSSLQEFEHLENAVAENAKKREQQHSSSQDSSSNGSLPRRYTTSHSTHGDDVSVSSVKDFEVLEKACRDAHMIELRAREEEDLLDHESPENRYKLENLARAKAESQGSPAAGSFNPSTSGSDDYEKRIKEIDEIIKLAQASAEKIEKHEDIIGDVTQITSAVTVVTASSSLTKEKSSSATVTTVPGTSGGVNLMETSTDSLELEDNGTKNLMCRSSDSLELKMAIHVPPSLSSDSLNNARDAKYEQDKQSDPNRRISSDSLEFSTQELQDATKIDSKHDSSTSEG